MTTFAGLLRTLARLVRAIRQLTLQQITSRLAMIVRFQAYRRFPALAAAQTRGSASFRDDALATLTRWTARRYPNGPSSNDAAVAEKLLAGRFRFAEREADLGHPPREWRPTGQSRLWLYHLHYFDYARSLALWSRAGRGPAAAEHGWAIADDWLQANLPGSMPGWEPYPASIRLVNWLAAWALAPDALRAFPGGVGRLANAIAAHARFVERHLEFHIGGNHLIKNARALVFAGRVLDGPEADRWTRKGTELLRAEIRRQVLADGGHSERSPLYQCIVLEDLVDCVDLTEIAPNDLHELAGRMIAWLDAMSHPDGGLSLFNDSVAFPEPTPRDVTAYGRRVIALPQTAAARDPELIALPDSGYFVLRSGDGRAIVDCGDIGPPELGAHAHADTLSFELTWRGERVIVDSGVSEYRSGELRDYVRSTRAHNTAVIDRTDQSELWGSHRSGRRARPLRVALEHSGNLLRFVGAHDGYRRLGVTHFRHIVAVPPAWIVIDEILGRGQHDAATFIHLHPDLHVEHAGAEASVRSGVSGIDLRVRAFDGLSFTREPGRYSAGWGIVRSNAVMRLAARSTAPLAIGYVLCPAETTVEIRVRQRPGGVTISTSIGGVSSVIESDRPAGIF